MAPIMVVAADDRIVQYSRCDYGNIDAPLFRASEEPLDTVLTTRLVARGFMSQCSGPEHDEETTQSASHNPAVRPWRQRTSRPRPPLPEPQTCDFIAPPCKPSARRPSASRPAPSPSALAAGRPGFREEAAARTLRAAGLHLRNAGSVVQRRMASHVAPPIKRYDEVCHKEIYQTHVNNGHDRTWPTSPPARRQHRVLVSWGDLWLTSSLLSTESIPVVPEMPGFDSPGRREGGSGFPPAAW